MKKTKKVLIIDDEKPIRDAIKTTFKSDKEYDFETHEAVNEEDAMAILKDSKRRFDVVIIDLNLTGKTENVVRAMKAGADNVIDKAQDGSIKKLLKAVKEELRARGSDENEPDDDYLQQH